jgi:hypothetical protein
VVGVAVVVAAVVGVTSPCPAVVAAGVVPGALGAVVAAGFAVVVSVFLSHATIVRARARTTAIIRAALKKFFILKSPFDFFLT